jgi:hypothetical protein
MVLACVPVWVLPGVWILGSIFTLALCRVTR